ncbi:MAG: ligase-associated DNA damage response exonuclease [Pseudomonadota bacterium]
MTRQPVLSFTDRGIYCAAGDFFIDPWRPVDRALITHGHADHARPGHGRYLATHAALPIMHHRLGQIEAQGAHYGEVIRIGDADVSFHPAGHVPGSAQIKVAAGGEVWVASGDYKIEDDGLSEPFEPQQCHHFITESTFGLPIFRWKSQDHIANEVNAWWRACADAGKTAFLGAYSLGKAQRLLRMLEPDIGPILTHGAIEGSNRVMRQQGIALPDTTQLTKDTDPKQHRGALVLAPPSALGSTWAKRFRPAESAFASGWMQLRGIRRRRAGDRGFVISDHADWPGLLAAIKETGAENIYVTHGYTDIFARYLCENGRNAQTVPTEFGSDDDESETEAEAAS